MSFTNYPLDTQECPLRLGSMSYGNDFEVYTATSNNGSTEPTLQYDAELLPLGKDQLLVKSVRVRNFPLVYSHKTFPIIILVHLSTFAENI